MGWSSKAENDLYQPLSLLVEGTKEEAVISECRVLEVGATADIPDALKPYKRHYAATCESLPLAKPS